MSPETAPRLLDEAIVDAREYLPRLKEGLSRVVEMLQGGSEGEAINLFIEGIEGLEWLATVLNAGVRLNNNLLGDSQDSVDRYRQILSNLLEAWNNKDLVLISDILEFEIIPLIDHVLEKISQGSAN